MNNKKKSLKLEEFSKKFALLISSGVPLVKSLAIIAEEEEIKEFSTIIRSIIESVKSGSRFSEALSTFPKTFSKSYIGMVRSGENQGILDKMMAKIGDGLRSGIIESGDENFEEAEYMIPEENNSQKIMQEIFRSSISHKASDIHIVPSIQEAIVNFRIDGKLREISRLEKKDYIKVISYIKLLSNLDVYERRLPQDGRIITRIDDKKIDMRVSLLPAIYGEKLTIHILDKENLTIESEKIFSNRSDLEKFKKMIEHPHGLIVFSGPAGSGKTTTAYCAIEELRKKGNSSIITIEDPVEHIFDGVISTQINSKIGFGFKEAIISSLNLEPDILFIGEIRDKEILNIAMKATNSNVLVLTQFHSTDSADFIKRTMLMNSSPYLLASSLSGIISQRLIRNLCKKCAKKSSLSKETMKLYGLKNSEVYEAVGCPECGNSGYAGRSAIYEFYIPGREFKELILKGELKKIESFLKKEKYQRLKESAFKLLSDGITSLSEVMRVVGDMI